MAGETKTVAERKKPKFLRSDSHKRMKLGKGIKKNQKWRGAKGRQNKIRLGRKSYARRPKIGWGNKSEDKNMINEVTPIRVENINDVTHLKVGQGILIANIGKKKRLEIIKAANEKKLKILNRYMEKKK